MIELKLTDVTRSTATITWRWTRDEFVTGDPSGYLVKRCLPGDDLEMIALIPGRKFIDHSLKDATTYIYEVSTRGLNDTETDSFQVTTEPANEYANHIDFFEHMLAPTFGRDLGQTSHYAWCPQWWRHREANKAVLELWRSYESQRAPDDPTEASTKQAEWLVVFAYPLLHHVWDPRGTFRGCDTTDEADGGHKTPIKSPPLAHEHDVTGKYLPDT